MCWHELKIKPRDVLFFRDATPISGASIGQGATWPLPNALHDALIHTLKREWPNRQDWEHQHKNKNKKDNRDKIDFKNLRFGGLQTIGPFPQKDDTFYLPTPKDIDPDGNLFQLLSQQKECSNDLPDFLTHAAAPNGAPSKKEIPSWIPCEQYCKYLEGESVSLGKTILFESEARPGIGIDPETGTADKGKENEGGKFYLAEYLRLHDDVSMKSFARCDSSIRGEKSADVMGKLFPKNSTLPFIFGGQQGVVSAEGKREEHPFWKDLELNEEGLFVKWILLAPAVFSKGWLPDIVNGNGVVKGKRERPAREKGQTRAQWRKAIAETPDIQANLVAACTGKPVAFSGWNLRIGGPKPTMLAVPAGSVYWFKASTKEDADALIRSLHGRCRSEFYGEKGFGFGICTKQNEL